MYYKAKTRGRPVQFTLWIDREIGGQKESIALEQGRMNLN